MSILPGIHLRKWWHICALYTRLRPAYASSDSKHRLLAYQCKMVNCAVPSVTALIQSALPKTVSNWWLFAFLLEVCVPARAQVDSVLVLISCIDSRFDMALGVWTAWDSGWWACQVILAAGWCR